MRSGGILGRRIPPTRSPPRWPRFAGDLLAAHNLVRGACRNRAAGVVRTAGRAAQDWADTLLARKQFAHRPNPTFGENLFEIVGASASASASGQLVGFGNRTTTSTARTRATACAGTTRRSCGGRRKKSAARWRAARTRGVGLQLRSAGGNWIGKRRIEPVKSGATPLRRRPA